VADGRLRPGGDQRPVVDEDALVAEDAHRLALELLAGDGRSLPEPGPDRVVGALRGAERPPDAGQLGVRLDPPAAVEQLSLRLDVDRVRAQVVGDLEREVARGHCRLDLGRATGPEHELRRHLVPGEALCDQLVQAELLERHRLEPRDLAQPRDLERAHEGRARAVPLDVHERVGHGDGHLVAQLRGADGVAEDENVGHGSRW
jgi:hypothetical protein